MDESILFWRKIVLKQFNALFSASTSYTPEQIQKHLDHIDKWVLERGALGPRPTCSIASWKTFLTDDFSPIEYSLSIKKGACIVRYAIEPISSLSGTLMDPVNYLAPTQWIRQYEDNDVDLSWYHILASHLTTNASEQPHMPLAACGLSQYAFGFDFLEKPVLKSYILHDPLARQTSASPMEWATRKDELVCKAMDAVGLGVPWSKVMTYLEHLNSHDPEYAGQTRLIGWDPVDPKTARMKIYVDFIKADLPHFLSHLDLGGTLDSNDQHCREIKTAATEMWNAFAIENNDLQDCSTQMRSMIIYYEMRKGEENPKAKFYLRIRHHFSSDLEISKRFDDFLASKGFCESGWYNSLMESYCEHRALSTRSGLQTVVGCAVRDGEWELSMYLSPEAYAPERWALVPPVSARTKKASAIAI